MRVENDFFSYTSGVYYSEEGCSGGANHEVTCLGYGAESGMEYWLLTSFLVFF